MKLDMRIQSRLIGLLLFVTLGASLCIHLPASVSGQDKAPPTITPLPDEVMNAELKTLDGRRIRLADYRGKIVLVNLWATWCGPCRYEIPHLEKFSQEFKAKGVEIIGLTSEDPETEVEKVQDFVDEFKITYRIGWADQDFAFGLMQGKVKRNIPQSFVISRDGRVLTRFIGFNQDQTPTKLRKVLEDAINEK